MFMGQRVGRGSKVGMGDEKSKGTHAGGRAQHNE